MPNYHLAIQHKDKSFNIINFSNMESFKFLDDKKLIDIIKFTGYYEKEDHLKNTLLNAKLINESEYNNKLVTIYKNNGKNKKLMYGVTYKNDLKFFDVLYIKTYIKKRKFDTDFLEGLANHYRNNYGQDINTQVLFRFVRYVQKNEFQIDLDKDLIKDVEKSIEDLVDREAYRYTNGKTKFNYRGLRDLAMYLAYHENKKSKNDEIIEEHKNEKEEFLTREEIEKMVNFDIEYKDELPKVKVKKKRKKRKKIDPNQMTLADFGIKIDE